MLANSILRQLSSRDIPELLQIEQQVQSCPWSEAMFADCFGERYLASGLQLGEQLVGFCIMDYVLDEGNIHNIAVLPAYHRLGLGMRLLNDAVQQATVLNLRQLYLEVRASNEAGIALYQKRGFNQIGRRTGYYPLGSEREDGIVMSLELPLS